MQMKKISCRIAVIVVALCAVMMVVGCSGDNKDPLTPKEFKTIMEEKGIAVTDQTEAVSGDSSYQDVYVAYAEGKYSFEYYFMKNESSASELYAVATKNLEKRYDNDSSATVLSSSIGSTNKYEVSASDYYCVAWQNKNAMLYMTAYSNYKDEAKEILKKLGY